MTEHFQLLEAELKTLHTERKRLEKSVRNLRKRESALTGKPREDDDSEPNAKRRLTSVVADTEEVKLVRDNQTLTLSRR